MLEAFPRFLGALAVLGVALGASPARAECQPDNGLSPCVDANSLWLSPGGTRWSTFSEGPALMSGRVAMATAVQLTTAPLVFVVPSPDLTGREVRAVERVIEQNLLLAAGLGRNLELGLALAVILHQRGAGDSGLSAQNGAPLPSSAERDPRVMLSYSLEPARDWWLKPRVGLGIPLGDTSAYASSGAFTVAPALPLSFRRGRFGAAAELGARLRRAVDFGTLRWGSQLAAGLGVGVDVLPERWLSLGVEGWLLTPLIASDTARARALGVSSRVWLAEGMFALRSFPERGAPWSVALAAGGALPASRQELADGSSESFVAPTSPGLRLLAEIRYSPER